MLNIKLRELEGKTIKTMNVLEQPNCYFLAITTESGEAYKIGLDGPGADLAYFNMMRLGQKFVISLLNTNDKVGGLNKMEIGYKKDGCPDCKEDIKNCLCWGKAEEGGYIYECERCGMVFLVW